MQGLLDAGVDVNARDSKEERALHRTVRTAGNKGYLSYCGWTGEQYLDTIRLLLAKGASFDAQDVQRRTPLHYACGDVDEDKEGPEREHLAVGIVSALIAAGCDVNAVDENYMTPLISLPPRRNHLYRSCSGTCEAWRDIRDRYRSWGGLDFAAGAQLARRYQQEG